MAAEIKEDFAEDDYSGAATYNIDFIDFIDTVNQSTLTHQQPSQMKMKYAEHAHYSFTKEEKKFLNTDDKLNGICVIDNFVGIYDEELKLNRNHFIKPHDYYYNIDTSLDLDEAINYNHKPKPNNNIKSIIKPELEIYLGVIKNI